MENKPEPKKSTNLGSLNIDLLRKIKGSDSGEDQEKNREQIRDLFNRLRAESEQVSEQFAENYPVKNFDPINFNFLELSFDDVKKLSSDDLLKLLSSDGHEGKISSSTLQLISNELLMRQMKEASKPHWTVYLGIVLAFIAALTGIIQLIFSK